MKSKSVKRTVRRPWNLAREDERRERHPRDNCIALDPAVTAEENRQLVKGLQRVGLLSRQPVLKSGHAGSSLALYVRCPICEQPAGDYCMKDDGSPQIIAHKKRRELASAVLS